MFGREMTKFMVIRTVRIYSSGQPYLCLQEETPFLLSEFCCHHSLLWMHDFRCAMMSIGRICPCLVYCELRMNKQYGSTAAMMID